MSDFQRRHINFAGDPLGSLLNECQQKEIHLLRLHCFRIIFHIYESILKTNYMSCLMTKPAKWHVRPAKTQISLGIRPVWSVFNVCIKKAWVLRYALSAQRRLWSDWADAQADLSLRWAHSHFVGFAMRWLNYTYLLYLSHVMRKPIMPYVNNKGAYQPAHPHSLISTFFVRCMDSIIFLLAIAEISRP